MVTNGCTWEESDRICRQFDGTLAKITRTSEGNSAISIMKGIEDDVIFHIGLKNEVDRLHSKCGIYQKDVNILKMSSKSVSNIAI